VSDQRSIVDRIFGLCVSFFLACLAIYAGVQLLQAVIVWIVAGLIVLGLVAAGVAVLQWRRERW